ncbi:hypothetical protein SJAV_01620 [Sulfurisphaera javensis]|uniref:Uncharacterized protein n=1 Tax=Sulfurisphaera javensis TaxID=2049879 RepID=A0AAT9GNC2_9CREN
MTSFIVSTNEEVCNSVTYSVTTISCDVIMSVSVKDIYNSYTIEKAESELKYYLQEDEIKYLERVIDIRKLISLIRLLESLGLHVEDVEIVAEEQEIVFIEIMIDIKCDMKSWTTFTKNIKKYLKESGFSDITKIVAILCHFDKS